MADDTSTRIPPLQGRDTTENFIHIGKRIKSLRMHQKRTLQEIADSSDLSKSMISKIENNKTVPSVAALVKIGKALGTNISNLLEQDGWARTVFTTQRDAIRNLTLTEKGYSIFPYAASFHEKKMQPFLFSAKKGEVVPHRLSHEGEEYVFIVEGEMKMTVGEVEYVLKKGDSLYFSSLQKHGIMPVSDTVIYLDIFV
ncbi:helix-turn-helix domain-containing protein [Mucilaginibacter sp. UR6-11]|uniref:helix-turn-helix domain-containing protein n=1 Tax=Mucilaginibacter sp. UR6-11 TaxID=1435644 RepID=UPI001E2B05A8|nr:XRE family transcriptional regulator [Mucilaginibacter sp. UR6-11]MCC8424064.1 XRE family transcriptional regulator [Mucilaginibacter sp. UR6-11]